MVLKTDTKTEDELIPTIEEGLNERSQLLNSKEGSFDILLPLKTQHIKDELVYMISASIPIVLSTFTQFAIPTLNLYSMGQFGTLEISSVALSTVFASSTGTSISFGMATALDTLCSQAFTGAKDKHQVGFHLQRGILIQMLMLIPILLLWWNSEFVLLFLQQDPEVSVLCGKYLRVLMLGMPPFILFELLKKFLQAQRIMRAQTYVLAVSLPIAFLINYLLLWNPSTQIGFLGAPFTIVGANWSMFLLMIGYIYFIEGKECWGGWTKECLTNWTSYIKLGSSGVLMLCSEWWGMSLISLTVSYLGTQAMAAHYIGLNVDMLLYSIPLSIGIVASNRIGNLLGAKQVNRAKLSSFCALSLALIIPAINATILSVYRNQIASIFTKDLELVNIIGTLVPLLCVYHVFDSITCCSSGILRGQGRQRVGACVNLICWYVLAIPISVFISFYLGYGVRGMWFGICIALCSAGCSLGYLVLNSDWDQLIQDTIKRLSVDN